MNKNHYILKTVILSALMASSFSAWSATNNFAGTFHVSKFNSGFSDSAMRTTSRHMCFLSRVGVEETDVRAERSTCTIYSRSGFWRLRADVGRRGDNDVTCSAICYTR